MKDTLAAGLEHSVTSEVTPEMSPAHLNAKVLSTPSMIQLMEMASLQLVVPHLDDGETTVGTHVCVSHVAGAAAGEQVTIRARLSEVAKRRLTFDVSAHCGDRLLGEGTHQRAVVDVSRFGG
jgi:fluoroacetyl-CoA thioesterase